MKTEHPKVKDLEGRYVPTTEFYSQIIESLTDYSILTIDTDFIINSWSAGAAKIFGYQIEEIIGKPFDIIFTDEDKKEGVPNKEIDTAIRTGRAVDNRWHICKDGNTFFAYGLVFPLKGENGKLIGYVKILRDLTERRKSEEEIKSYIKELEDLNIHKDSILAILSHDLRSPLAAIIQTADYLKSNIDTIPLDETKEFLELLHKESTEELYMLDYLLEWARIKYAADTFTPQKIELTEHVRKVFDTLKETASKNEIILYHELEKDTIVFADSKMLLSILLNIISNAIKHSHKGEKIKVTAKESEGKMIVEIKDTGIGMSQHTQNTLFTPQINFLSIARNQNKGAGIGLLLAKAFLEKNGGDIWVDSIEDEGSSFYFTLPLEKTSDKIKNGNKILFHEDE